MQTEHNDHAMPPGMILRTGSHAFGIEKVISAGGFGVTYMATNLLEFRTLGRVIRKGTRVVVKECFREECMHRLADGTVALTKASGEVMRRNFISEAQLISKCQGQFAPSERGTLRTGLVPVYHAGQIGSMSGEGIFYYVVPYIDGGTLSGYLGRLTVADVVMLLCRLLKALERLHAMKNEKGESIVHGDIKPQNIMLTRDRYPVLIDFGGAVARVKTPTFAAPEQEDRSARITPAADLFSLAVTFYFILRGKLPPNAEARTLPGGKDMLDETPGALLNEHLGLLRAFREFGKDTGFSRYRSDWAERFLYAIDVTMSLDVRKRLTIEEWQRVIMPRGSEYILASMHGGSVATVSNPVQRDTTALHHRSSGAACTELISRLWKT